MVFSSIVFLFYFLPIFFLIYFIADTRYKNFVILSGSIFFYSWGAPKFIFVILGTTFIDYFLVRIMADSKTKLLRNVLLCISLSLNLGLLFYFKYCNFFVDNFNQVLQVFGAKEIGLLNVVLPIGISFYTFETLTYVIDVYRGIHRPLNNFWDYQLYIIFFPKLIAGPIVRYHDFGYQIYEHTQNNKLDDILHGFYIFCLGLGKKVIIANSLGAVVAKIALIDNNNLATSTAWYGAIAYTFQIYFDFSGYSDMAIGLSKMMGFNIPDNFNNPYTSVSITDFWRRWHISLGNWMRNYLYIPLGGNRVNSKSRLYFNLWLVFILSGLWHGAMLGFIFWGMYHGFFLVLERLFLGKWLQKLGKLSVIYTFFVVTIGWVFFRIGYINTSFSYIKRMFTFNPQNCNWVPDIEFYSMLLIGCIFSFFTLFKFGERVQQRVYKSAYSVNMHLCFTILALVLIFISSARITSSNFNPFIYFRF